MDEVSNILREAREQKSLSFEEVSSKLRIPEKFLSALEEGRYEDLPTPIHVRGYLRNYARHLGLDPQPLLDRFAVTQSQQQSYPTHPTQISAETPLPERADNPFFSPGTTTLDNGNSGRAESILRIMVIVALVISIILVASQFYFPNKERGEFNPIEAVGTIVSNEGDPEDFQFELPEVDSSGVITSTGRDILDNTTLPTATAERPPLPAVMENVELQLEITERTWLEITIDGTLEFRGQAKAGDVFEYTANEEARVYTGNAVGIVATVNEVLLGRLGGRGDVIEEVWQTTN